MEEYIVKYGADKMKITVIESDIDRKYFADILPWTMDGQSVSVVQDNEHLGHC